MWRLVKRATLIALLMSVPVLANAEDPQDYPEQSILIVELQTASIDDAGDEFIELYNATDKPIEGKNLKIQYRSATGNDWNSKATLEGTLQPRGRYLVGTSRYADISDITRSLGLAASGGHIRIIDTSVEFEQELDQLAWGTAQYSINFPAPAPESGKSLKRSLDEDGKFRDTNDDLADWFVSDTPSPQRSLPPPEKPQSTSNSSSISAANGSNGGSASVASENNGPYAKLELTELFPDPKSPLTDAEDEFVEIYNPTNSSVDLEGYVIKTGKTYSYKFTLPPITLKPGEYFAFFSIDTTLTLSNSEGGAILLDPNGNPQYEVPAYSDAPSGYSWANVDDGWQWTASPTPGKPNKLSAQAAGESASLNGGLSSSDLVRGQVASAISLDGRATFEEPPTEAKDIDSAVVAGVGGLALLYVGYEYRYDVANRFNQLKRYLQSRRSGRSAP